MHGFSLESIIYMLTIHLLGGAVAFLIFPELSIVQTLMMFSVSEPLSL